MPSIARTYYSPSLSTLMPSTCLRVWLPSALTCLPSVPSHATGAGVLAGSAGVVAPAVLSGNVNSRGGGGRGEIGAADEQNLHLQHRVAGTA